MAGLIGNWLATALGIAAIAWLLRLPFRRARGPLAAALSVAVASVLGFYLRGIADGEGSLAARWEEAARGDQAIIVIPAIGFALGATALVGWAMDRRA